MFFAKANKKRLYADLDTIAEQVGILPEERPKQQQQTNDGDQYVIATIPEGIGLYKVISDEDMLSDSMRTIKPMKIYESVGDAIAALMR